MDRHHPLERGVSKAAFDRTPSTKNINMNSSMSSIAIGSVISPAAETSNPNETSTVASTSTSLQTNQYNAKKILSSFFSYLFYFQDGGLKKGYKNYIFFLVLNIYFLYIGIFLPVLGESLTSSTYGEWGVWLANVLNWPLSLSLDRLPYIGSVVISFVGVGFVFILCCVVGASMYAFKITSKFLPYLRQVFSISCRVFLLGSSVFLFVMMNTIFNCDLDQGVLTSFPNEKISCYSSMSQTQILFTIVFSLASILLIILNGVCLFITTNCHMLNSTPFISESPIIIACLQSTTLIQLCVQMLVPFQYSYVRSAIHLICSIGLAILHFKTMPFYKKIDNSLFGIGLGARVGAALAALVSNILFTTVPKSSFDYNGLGIGLACFVLVLAVLFGITYCVFVEFVVRRHLKLIRNNISEFASTSTDENTTNQEATDGNENAADLSFLKVLESGSFYFYQGIMESGYQKSLALFLKFSFLSNSYIRSIGGNVSVYDVDATIAFIKGITTQSSFTDYSLLILFASIISNVNIADSNAQTFSKSVLSKIKRRKPGLYYKYQINVKLKEIAKNETGTTRYELQNSLEDLELQQDILRSLHRDVWKELMNEIVNYNILEATVLKIGSIIESSDTTYNNLLSAYPSDKDLVISYGKFLESFMFNKEEATELFTEAIKLEAEEKNAMKAKVRRSVSNKAKYRFSGSDSMYRKNKAFNMSATEDDNASDPSMNVVGESFDGIENRNDVFRNNLAIPHSTSFRCSLFVAFVLFSLLFFAVCLSMSIYFSYMVTSEVMLVFTSCSTISTNTHTISEVRTFQAFSYLYKNESDWSQMMKDYGYETVLEYKQSHRAALNDIINTYQTIKNMASHGKFSLALYSDFHEVYYPLYKPQTVYGSNNQSFTSFIQINATIADFTNMAISSVTDLISSIDSGHNSTYDDYAFMWVYYNNDTVIQAFNSFCNQYMDRSIDNGAMYQYIIIGVYFSLLFIYLLLGILFIYYVYKDLKFTDSIFKLYEKSISKNIIGKIYHSLNARNGRRDVSLKIEYSKVFNPRMLVIFTAVGILVFTSLSCGLFVEEMTGNGVYARQSYVTMKDSNDAAYYLQHLIFAVTELYMHTSLPSSLPIINPPLRTSSEVYALYSEIEPLVAKVRYFWNLCMYGSSTKKDETLVIGMYPEIDMIIRGDDNCTFQEVKKYGSNCTISMDTVVATMLDLTVLLSQKVSSKSSDVHELYAQVLLYMTHVSSTLIEFSGIFAIYAAVPLFSLDTGFGIVTVPFITILFFFIYKQFSSYSDGVNSLRMILNYLNTDAIESSEDLRNYILFHQVDPKARSTGATATLKRTFSKSNKVYALNDNNTSIIQSVLNASIDGVAMCWNSKGDIDAFNPVAQTMFGYNKTEIIGTSIFDLFEDAIKDKVKKSVEAIVQSIRSNQSNEDVSTGETFEGECIRKNKTKFPSKISIFVVLHKGKELVVCFIADQTSEKKKNALLQDEKKHSEELLLNILPFSVANKLKNSTGESFISEKLNCITCFFSDMVGFTQMSSNMASHELVGLLNEIVNGFDDLTLKYNIEKIKTIGDAYFAVSGLNELPDSDHAERMCKFACESFGVIKNYNTKTIEKFIRERFENNQQQLIPPHQINIRVGINTGPATSGVIGKRKFAFDLWGDTVNTASRMESTSIAGRIQISRATYERVHDMYTYEERIVQVKGKGECQTYLIQPIHHENPIIEFESLEDVNEENQKSEAIISNI
ncbi:membrane bound PAS domain-containing adenylate/guanylate cyclase [Naegleria gruberi]|uniref:Membrane bound PAS domain-containing adenylate/guanylate cyclase n=1 Tax=Naegleria gruberi TaxID=5762 RepID=D2VY89_NAEGR|nr:membrane bound PAS domain-containing adenylate/guanylate cyclase [Naegleria gruberi]EFC38208.1 membrane bound PAS domain-containing adenylate/guanylate cyclase [Naegleria gruberi]|eukprot:XP_002670952.1 membrane bound PAS domain-containing adenylate/guanylate cyclase [Naegleria gruberi strain NEG-M]